MPCLRGEGSGSKIKRQMAQLKRALSYLFLAAEKGDSGPAISLPCTGGGYTACPGRGFHTASLLLPLPPMARNIQFAQAIFQLTKTYVSLVVEGGRKRSGSQIWIPTLAVLMIHCRTLGKLLSLSET